MTSTPMTRPALAAKAREIAAAAFTWPESRERIENAILSALTDADAAATERAAKWMIAHSYATGHGDCVVDLLKELEWQAMERATERAAKVVEGKWGRFGPRVTEALAAAIRNQTTHEGEAA